MDQEKHEANLRTTEAMLTRYIQQRKKPLAELALQTLAELAPGHPRLDDYRTWVADLDQELTFQRRIDEHHHAAELALRSDDLVAARRHLDALRRLDPDGDVTEELARELSLAERGLAESADIERLKQRFHDHVERGDLTAAETTLDQLGRLDLPKISLDFLRKRIDEAQARRRAAAELQASEERFRRHLVAGEWQAARDLAQRVGESFPASLRPAEMFNEVNQREAEERRRQSNREGIAQLERFLSEGRRAEAELALKVLERLDFDRQRLASYQERLARM